MQVLSHKNKEDSSPRAFPVNCDCIEPVRPVLGCAARSAACVEVEMFGAFENQMREQSWVE